MTTHATADANLTDANHRRRQSHCRQAQTDHRGAGGDLRPPPAHVQAPGRAGQAAPHRRRHLQLADHRAAAGLAEPRPRLEGLGCRRQRVRRPARRLRRRAGRPRSPRDRQGRQRTSEKRHPLRPADTRRDHRGGRTRQQVRPAELAFRQLGHRSHHGRRPPDALGHRPGPDHQDRGLLPRPPRLGAGLRRPRGRRRRPAGKPSSAPSSSGIPRAITDLTLIATFNDLDSVARLLDEHEGQIAGMILEPVMMNAGIIKPEPGYLAGLNSSSTTTTRCSPSTRSRPA